MEDEIFDVVDADDRVIGQASRGEVHRRNLMHRAVHVLVYDRSGRLYLQKRAMTKDENPGLWDTSAAGHVNAGEGYATCAERELEEELGLRAPLEFLGKLSAGPDTLWEHVEVYRCVTDDAIVINPLEIDEGRFWTLDEVRAAILDDAAPITSTFRVIFNKCLK